MEGNFDGSSQLSAHAAAVSASDFDLSDDLWDLILSGFTTGTANTAVVEQWELSLPEDNLDTHTIRYLPPNGKHDRMTVYILRDGIWEQADTQVAGSYITFPFTENTAQIAVVSTLQMWWVRILAGVLLLTLLLLTVKLIRRLLRRRKKAVPPPMASKAADDGGEAIIRVPPPVTGRKKKRWLTPLLVILALLIGIAGTAAFFLLPDWLAGEKAIDLLKTYSEKPELSMSLTVDAVLGEDTYTFCGDIDRVQADGASITVISEDGKHLYYTDGAVILENGKAYALSNAFPDYSQLLEQALALYCHVDIREVDGVYAMTAKDADAKAILEILLPGAGETLPETDGLQVGLITEDGELTAISFALSANGFALDARLDLLEEPREVIIPKAVLDAVKSGEYGSLDALTQEGFRLFSAWENLNSKDALSAALTLEADCGHLNVTEDLTLSRWNTDADPIFCLEKNGYALYFAEDQICDSKGNTVPAASVNLDAAQLLDLAYAVSLGADVQCVQSGNRDAYTITLDEAGMEAAAYAIAPKAQKQNLTLESGQIQITVADDTLETITVTIGGSVDVVLAKVNAGFAATIDFTGQRDIPPLPQTVAQAL